MNKGAVISVITFCVSLTVIVCYFIYSNQQIKLGTKLEKENTSIPMDRFTTCINTVMLRSIEANKPITASEAKDICLRVEKA